MEPMRRNDPERLDVLYNDLVKNGQISDELPLEILQEILLRTENTPRSQISKAMQDRVVTIYKDKKLAELQEVVKNLIEILGHLESPTVSTVIQELTEYLEALPKTNPFIALRNRTEIQDRFYSEIQPKLQKLSDRDLRDIVSYDLGIFPEKYLGAQTTKLIIREMISKNDGIGINERIHLLTLAGEFQEIFSRLDGHIRKEELGSNIRQEAMQSILKTIFTQTEVKEHLNDIYQIIEYLQKNGLNWIDLVEDDPVAIQNIVTKLLDDPASEEVYELYKIGENDKAFEKAQAQPSYKLDSVKIDVILVLLLNRNIDDASSLVNTLPESKEKETLFKLINVLKAPPHQTSSEPENEQDELKT